jgi:hypothetical protein
MRRDVLSGLSARGPSLTDRAYTGLALLAAPAPHLVRVLVSLGLVTALAAGATVASADALPDEPLYGMKVAGEQVRLALARTPEDRAVVQLSMAEHRLAEAERLALAGREPDALVATSAYGTHVANAAAELAAVEQLEPTGRAVVDRLKSRLTEQQTRAAEVATRLAADPISAAVAPVFRTLASAPPSPGTTTVAEQIADHAARVNSQLAAVAEQRSEQATEDAGQAVAQPAAPAPAVAPAAAAPAAAPAAVVAAQAPKPANAPATRTAAPQPAKTAVPTAKPEAAVGNVSVPDAAAKAEVEAAKREVQAALEKAKKDFQAALQKVKREHEKAAEAAKKAKELAKRTPSPKPAPKTTPKPRK